MAPTDSEQGEVAAEGLADEGELEEIALREHGAEGGMGLLAVVPRVDVGAAGEEEPVHPVEQLRHVLRPSGRDDEGQPARRFHGAHVVVAEAEDLALAARVLDRDPDGGPAHIRSGTGIPSSAVRTPIWRTKASTTSVRKARRSSLSAYSTE